VTAPARQRIVVTGGAGFIGVHTVARLVSDGHHVLVIDDLRHPCGEPVASGVDLVVADVVSASAVDAVARYRPDAIVHLAAQGGVSRSVRDPVADATVNVMGTVTMLKASVDAGCRRFVFASSGGAVYGKALRLPTPEQTVPRPLSPYGAAKLAAEGYLGTFARTFGLRAVALRYANVYGPYQDGTGEAGVVAITCERLLSGRSPEIRGDGRQTRDFVFAADVAEANLRALYRQVEGVMNIGTGVATSVRQVVDRLVETAGYRGSLSFVEGRPGEVRETAVDPGRAARLLGWTAHTSLRDGLHQTFMSFRQRSQSSKARASGVPAAAGARPDRGSPEGSG
jgi:UDP-glucose 4-epimerase